MKAYTDMEKAYKKKMEKTAKTGWPATSFSSPAPTARPNMPGAPARRFVLGPPQPSNSGATTPAWAPQQHGAAAVSLAGYPVKSTPNGPRLIGNAGTLVHLENNFLERRTTFSSCYLPLWPP